MQMSAHFQTGNRPPRFERLLLSDSGLSDIKISAYYQTGSIRRHLQPQFPDWPIYYPCKDMKERRPARNRRLSSPKKGPGNRETPSIRQSENCLFSKLEIVVCFGSSQDVRQEAKMAWLETSEGNRSRGYLDDCLKIIEPEVSTALPPEAKPAEEMDLDGICIVLFFQKKNSTVQICVVIMENVLWSVFRF